MLLPQVAVAGNLPVADDQRCFRPAIALGWISLGSQNEPAVLVRDAGDLQPRIGHRNDRFAGCRQLIGLLILPVRGGGIVRDKRHELLVAAVANDHLLTAPCLTCIVGLAIKRLFSGA